MSLHSFYPYEQQPCSLFNFSAGSVDYYNFHPNQKANDFNESQLPRRRRDDTNFVINKLYEATLVRRTGEREIVRLGGRKNKNEILGLTNARLVKEKHLNGVKYSQDVELVRGIATNSNSGEFVLVLRTDGRIVAMSDEVEQHLGKSMRSLYTQCMNIFKCLDQADGEKLRSILSHSDDREHRLVCTFRLPKGKRPSRTREDIRTISIAGHFYSSGDASSKERLFVARCEALVSCHVNGASSVQSAMINNTMMKIVLNDDMTINTISSNVKDVLGYTRNEMIGHWFGRFLASEDLEKFEQLRQRYFHSEQQAPANLCQLLDFLADSGEQRLTFLCQIRPTRERRSKSVKYTILAQLIDPSMRVEYLNYIQDESFCPLATIKVEQVNHVSPKTNEDCLMADSPSLAMGLLMLDAEHKAECHPQQYSPINRSLSNLVAPFVFDDGYDAQAFSHDFEQFFAHKTFDEQSTKYAWTDEFASLEALMYDY